MDDTGFTVITKQLGEFKVLLDNALLDLNLLLDELQRRQLLLYLDKLLFWNKAYNLTAIKQPKEALIKHIFDCLAIVPHLQAGRLLDIGTGAGLPGVIVAICQPQRQITVLDSNQKKIRFIRQLVSELNLQNVTPVASRIEQFDLAEIDKFEVITSRAFASLDDFIAASKPLLAVDGVLQAMKGMPPTEEEVSKLAGQWQTSVLALQVPKLDENRTLVTLQKVDR